MKIHSIPKTLLLQKQPRVFFRNLTNSFFFNNNYLELSYFLNFLLRYNAFDRQSNLLRRNCIDNLKLIFDKRILKSYIYSRNSFKCTEKYRSTQMMCFIKNSFLSCSIIKIERYFVLIYKDKSFYIMFDCWEKQSSSKNEF